jgi:hypothetical protein
MFGKWKVMEEEKESLEMILGLEMMRRPGMMRSLEVAAVFGFRN